MYPRKIIRKANLGLQILIITLDTFRKSMSKNFTGSPTSESVVIHRDATGVMSRV